MGRAYEYLRTNIYFSKEDKFVIRNDKYVADILEYSRNDMDREAVSPLPEHLFVVNAST